MFVQFSVNLKVTNSNGENQLTKQNYIKVISSVLCPEYTQSRTLAGDSIYIHPLRKDPEERFQVYPNPVVGNIVIHGTTSSMDVDIKIFNLLGCLVYSSHMNWNHDQSVSNIETSQFNDGIYFVEFSSSMGRSIQKIYLQKTNFKL